MLIRIEICYNAANRAAKSHPMVSCDFKAIGLLAKSCERGAEREREREREPREKP